MTKLQGLLALAAMALALTPKPALAEEWMPFQGSFTIAYVATSNTANVGFCGGPTGTAAFPFLVEAHGVGTSTLGFLSLTLEKTLDAVGPMHGCVTLTAVNGDTVSATYDGTEGPSLFFGVPSPNGFQFGTGTLTFTGGTGRFRGARGEASFTASFSQIETASYLFAGKISFARSSD